jgi:hypothetical protein
MGVPFKQEQALVEAKDWDALIDARKQSVRNFCSNTFRWAQLFSALVEARRYLEAVQTLNSLKERNSPLPFAVIEKTDAAFLAAEEFRASAVGQEYAARKDEIDELMRGAAAKLAAMTPSELPPNPYRSIGACPFECCTYREWTTRMPVQLVESIGSTKVIAEIPSGVKVQGVTGEVHLDAEPYVALENLGALKAGDVIFLLDNEGEGYVNYWFNGKLKPPLGLDEGLAMYSYESCLTHTGPGACSLRKLHPQKKFRNDWWVRVKTADGREGWALNTGQFGNIDACA